ncbi:hypothetical protein D1AOALGA4SA_4913 [Olavius algarvensis Delta 1 endosymbiont]|nr:hypothetical protein D1AOALGA4SA_4913 [Olavius algarvensis Delta 1 endosymbiont]
MMETLRSVVFKNRPFGKKAHDRQNTLFDVRCWAFDVRRWTFLSYFSLIRLAVFLARGSALINIKSEPQNIEYRTAECRRVESLRSVFL